VLPSADRAVVARDRVLPGLALLLDGGALAARIGRDVAPAYLRYKPHTSCAVGLIGHAATLGETFAAFTYPRDRYATVRGRPEWQDEAIFLDDVCVAIVPARLDRRLKVLRRLDEPERRAKHLKRMTCLPGAADEASVLRYKPGRRLVLRLSSGGVPSAVLKATAAEGFARSLIGATIGAGLGGAPLLGAHGETCTHVTGWIAGRPLCPVLGDGLAPAEAFSATGAALARLHAACPPGPFSIGRKEEVRALASTVADLAHLDLSLAASAERLIPRILEALGETPESRLLHGDFTADQVILGEAGPVIVDFDSAGSGDPAGDIGSFLARLDAQAIDGAIAPEDGATAGAALVTGYAEAAGGMPDTSAQHARALVMLATEGFRMRHPDWPGRTAALLGRAETILARPRLHPGTDPDLPQLAIALEPHRVLPALAAALGYAAGTLRRCEVRLVRHKPGRRAIVRYEIECTEGRAETLLGKLRAKGPDRQTARVQADLRAAGLDGSAPDGVGVPAPRGHIDSLHLWLQEAVPGEPLARHISPGADLAPVARTGAALARLHATAPVSDRRWTLADEADVLDDALRRAAERLPHVAVRLAAVGAIARDRLAALPPPAARGLHRDFYYDQVLVDGDRIWLVDLDLYACGDPAIDIANFLAHLDELALRRHGDVGAYARQAETFLAGYATVAPLPEVPRIAILRAVSIARHVFISTRFADRRHITSDLLAHAEAALDVSASLERIHR
jgi:aminoglycoside phosphotransferase (APT) family kinase protein